MPPNRTLWFDGPVGRLEARAHGPEKGQPVLLLHPHPRGGGSMGSRLVYDLAKGLAAAGFAAYRFNFRGVGRSDGQYDEGIGESKDARAVVSQLTKKHDRPPALIGHSFGGAVAIHVAAKTPVARLVVIGVPPRVTSSRLEPLKDAPSVRNPVHVVVGSKDEFVSPTEAAELTDSFGKEAELVVLEDAGHFLEPSHNPRVLDRVRGMLGHHREK